MAEAGIVFIIAHINLKKFAFPKRERERENKQTNKQIVGLMVKVFIPFLLINLFVYYNVLLFIILPLEWGKN